MSRKPDTPRDDDGPAGSGQTMSDIPPGRRFSGSQDILTIEAELVADGVELPNRAIPITYHISEREYEPGEIAEIIEAETNKENPNKNLIGYLNEIQQ